VVLPLVKMMEDKGFPPEISLAGAGIDLSADTVSYQQRITQLSNMLDLLGMDGAWLEFPRDVSISDYGLLGYAMMSSATLEQAVQIAARYHRMAGAMFELAFLVDGDEAILRIEHQLTGGRVGEYRFDRSELAQPLAEADANTARICEESCRKLLNQMKIEVDIVSRICHLLLSTPGEFPQLDTVAQKLSLGARTLRRRLNELGTSYQKILDDVRRELAVEYLQTTNLSVQEISELLGYSEVTNFRRAFMRWASFSTNVSAETILFAVASSGCRECLI